MNSRVFNITALTAGIAIAIAVGFLVRKQNGTTGVEQADKPATPIPVAVATAAAASQSKTVIEDILDRLQERRITPKELLAFRDSLLLGDPDVVIPAIREFLSTGKDVSTGLAFELGEGGSLESAPTLRLLLLDVLGQVSRKVRTADAADVSKQILAEKKSSDEWAIALRNVAWHDPQSHPYLATKFSEMVRYEGWQSQPSAGFLEAFDVAVFSRQVSVMEPLNEMLSNPQNDLQRAAAVALDRFAESAPLEVMQKLNSQPQMFSNHPFLRADWFAKADLREPAHRFAFEAYLARPDVTMAEKTKALKALASPGQFIADTLLTSPPTPIDDDARESAVLGAANDWTRRFPELSAPLTNLRERLAR
jgi:hypothetical protein